MLNPIRHGDSAEKISTYKVEPYVVAADIYGISPHTGRGGWTWYTGSAGWMCRLVIETLIGVKREGDLLHLTPHLPKIWKTFKVRYRYQQTHYHITVIRVSPDAADSDRMTVDGQELPEGGFDK